MSSVITSTQAAQILGVSRSTISRWAEMGRFPHSFFTQGGHIRIPISDVKSLRSGKNDHARPQAAIFLRSPERNDAETILGRGEAHLRRYAQERRYTVAHVSREIGPAISSQRPALNLLRSTLRNRAVYDIVLVETFDRLLLLGAQEFAAWAMPFTIVEAAGAHADNQRIYCEEVLYDMYAPLSELLTAQGKTTAEIEQIVAKGINGIADALGW